MMRETPCLECLDFSFYYGHEKALDRISFSLLPGEWLSIIGPNGSGKSTLLKNMLRLAAGGRRGGQLLIKGKSIDAYSQRQLARLLAYVPQAGGPIPPFTVREFANLSRYPFAGPGATCDPIEQALELTGTVHLADRRLDRLSGGQRQRVYLAAALAQTTPILLLDEPASFLDPRHAQAMNALLGDLHCGRGLTIIAVTHDLNQALDAGGLVLALKRGKAVFFGEASRLANGEGILEETFDYQFSYLRHPATLKPLVVA